MSYIGHGFGGVATGEKGGLLFLGVSAEEFRGVSAALRLLETLPKTQPNLTIKL